MKNRVLKVFTVFLLLTIFVGQFEYLSLVASDAPSTLEFIYNRDNEYPFKESGRNVFYRQATLGGNTAYCIDYGRGLPKEDTETGYATSLSWKYYMSGEALAVLVYGYPNNQDSRFNIKENYGEKAAYLVTQVAFWDVLRRNGEGNPKYTIDIDSIVANSGYENEVNAIKAVAKDLADFAIAHPYNVTPVANLDTTSYSIVEEGDKKVAGPYKVVGVNGTNVTNFTVKSVKATLTNAPSSATIVDKNRNAKSDFEIGEEIYVIANKSDTSANFNLNVNVSGDFLKCSGYGVNDSSRQNFATITTEPINVNQYVNITWTKDTGNIIIIKEDQNNNKIADVTFEIRDSADQKVAEATTNSNGRIDLNNIAAGKYTIKEISAPSGYILNSSSRSVTVASGQTVTETYENVKPSGVLQITKVDQNGDPVKDASFAVRDSNGIVIGTITTNAQGISRMEDLEIGDYSFVETKVPDEYSIDRTVIKFSILNANDTVTKEITNEKIIEVVKTGKLKIIKKDQNGSPIEGVKFTIYDKNDNVVQSIYTDSNGIAQSNKLELGKYKFEEVSAPSYVEMTEGKVSFSLTEDNQVVEKEVTNTIKEKKGTIYINKFDQNNIGIEGVKFKIYKVVSEEETFIKELTTDSEGTAEIGNLENGRYKIKEFVVPSGVTATVAEPEVIISDDNKVATKNIKNYRKPDEPKYGALKIIKKDEDGNYLKNVKFEIYNASNKKVGTIETNSSGEAINDHLETGTYYYKEVSNSNNRLRLNSELKEITVTENQITVENVINEYKTGGVKILKVDQNQNPIAGVTFEIYDENKNKVDTLVTDSSGITNTSKELRLGTYYYKEVSAPANIEMNPKMEKFTIENDGQIVEFKVVNNIIQGKLKIVKTDEKNKPIKGVKFDILNSDKSVIETIETDENGIAITSALGKGTYYYKEVKTLEQYVLDSSENEFKINSETDFVEAKVKNKLKAAKLIINKLSKEDNTPLKDIRFEIIDSNNNIIQSIVTDENGRAESDTLTYGTYYYKEVSAPDNYVLDSNLYEFNIKDNDVNVEKTIYNVKKKLPVTGSIFSADVIIVIVVTVSCIILYILIKMIIAYIANKNNNW